MILRSVIVAATLMASANPAVAASSAPYESDIVSARLLAAANGVAPGVGVVSAGLHVTLAPGWKTYWRAPGEVGSPPQLDWSASDNLLDVAMLYPAPERFHAFGIENYGYAGEVLFPLELTLAAPGEGITLAVDIALLVCDVVCVPEQFSLTLPLGPGFGVDADAAAAIADAAARTPVDAGDGVAVAALGAAGGPLTVQVAAARALRAPDVFPDMGAGAAFGPPEIRMAEDGRTLWAQFPVTGAPAPDAPVAVTIVDGAYAATAVVARVDAPPAPPWTPAAAGTDWGALLAVVGLAVLGGLILNVMPCVLPVLSLKVGAALEARARRERAARGGLLAAAAGVLAVMAALAVALVAARSAGLAVGWGLHFQNPAVVAAMFAILALFAANLFGLFDLRLPTRLNTALAGADGRSGLLGDFAAGAFGAMLATPCSAPFLGAAVAYALTGGPVDVFAVFAALGVGLATPYLLLAAAPGLLGLLPKPGPWMAWLKRGLGLVLAVAALWLLWILSGVGGVAVAGAGLAATTLALASIALRGPPALRGAGALVAGALVIAAPLALPPSAAPRRAMAADDAHWTVFDRAAIARAVARGETVFVDVTADWCLTCKANKALTLDRDPVAAALRAPATTAMRADWTRPDPAIARYLESHDRFGVPFNIVYGPNAPDGAPLPEILTSDDVLDALKRAGADR